MQIKNPKYNKVGTIDLEINHPVHGWLSFTASDKDVEELGKTIYAELITGNHGPIAEYTPEPEPVNTGAIPIGIPNSPPTPPSELSMVQLRLVLLDNGYLTDFTQALQALPSPRKDRLLIEWEFRTVVKRDSDLIVFMAESLLLKPEDLDMLFTEAKSL